MKGTLIISDGSWRDSRVQLCDIEMQLHGVKNRYTRGRESFVPLHISEKTPGPFSPFFAARFQPVVLGAALLKGIQVLAAVPAGSNARFQ